MNILQSKNIGIVHHNKDTDGFLSGALILKYLKDNKYDGIYQLIPYNYEKNFDNYVETKLQLKINDFDLLVFVDCSPSTDWFYDYFDYAKYNSQKIMIIDHHKNKIEELLDIMNVYGENINNRGIGNFEIIEERKNLIDIVKTNFNENTGYEEPRKLDSLKEYVEIYAGLSETSPVSAAYLVYKKYFKTTVEKNTLEQFVEFTSWYDTWRWFSNENYEIIHNETLYLETYLRKHWDLPEFTDENKLFYFYDLIKNPNFHNDDLLHKFSIGKNIHEIEVKKVDMNNFQFIVNLPSTYSDPYENLLAMVSFGTPSSFINQYYPRKHYMEKLGIDIDLMIYPKFDYENKIVRMSMRSIRMDLRLFIKYLKNKYGGEGGGHMNAARFELSFKNYNTLMSNFKFGLNHNYIYNE